MSRNTKSGAKAERDALRQEMLLSGCSHDLIALEMERRWGFRPREAHRHALGCSQDQIAARFNQIAERLGADRNYNSPMIGTRIGEYERWPHGGRRPSTYVLTVLAAAYHTTVDRLLDYDDYRNLPDQDRTVVGALLSGALPTPAAATAPSPTPSNTVGGLVNPAAALPAARPSAILPATPHHAPHVPRGGTPPASTHAAARPTAVLESATHPTPPPPGALITPASPAPAAALVALPHVRDAATGPRPTPQPPQPTNPTRPTDLAHDPHDPHEPHQGHAAPHMPHPADAAYGSPDPAPHPATAGPGYADPPGPTTGTNGTYATEHTPRLAPEPPNPHHAVVSPVPKPGSTVVHSPVVATVHAMAPTAPTAATALTPPAFFATRADVPAKSGSGARRRRRDELLDVPIGSALAEEEVIVAAAGQSAEFGEWAEATNVGPTTLEQFDQDVRRIAHGYLRGAPLPLLLATLRVRNRAFTLLEGRQHPRQSRDLYVVAGRICGLLAWMSGDVGRNAEAETQARTGWLCAELADHDGLRAWIRATQSKQAYWESRYLDSAQLAEAGLALPATDSARILLASLAARAWARLGRADDAHSALARADQERAAVDRPDEVGGLYGFSEAQQSYLAGTTHLWLREPAEALRAADRAVWLYEVGAPDQRFYGAETLALIDAATAQLHVGELDGMAAKLGPVLALPPEQRLETFTTRLGEMRRTLQKTRYASSRAAVDIQRRIEDFQAGALGHYLSR